MQQTERPLRESLLISSERAASILLHLFDTRLSLLLALQDTQHRQLHTAQERHQQRAQHPDTRRQIARDTPIYLSRHARRASRSVLGSSSEPGSVGRAGLTVAGLPLLCARYKHLVIEEGWFILRIHPLPIDSGRSEADRSLPIDLFPRNTLRRSASPPRSFARPPRSELRGDYSQ